MLLLFTFSRCSVYAREQHVLRARSVSDPNPHCNYFDDDGMTEKHDGVCTPNVDCPFDRTVGWGWYVIESPSLTLFFV